MTPSAITDLHSTPGELAPPTWAAINAEHAAAERAAVSALQHARNTGDMLRRMKADVGHGDWAATVAEHFAGSARTAQRYMRLAQRWPELEAKAPSVADMSLAAAEALLAKPRPAAPTLDRLADSGDLYGVVAGLREIRDRRLYRGTHESFEAYARERWNVPADLLTFAESGELYDLDLLDLGGMLHAHFTVGDRDVSGFVLRDPTATNERYLVCRLVTGDAERGEVGGTGRGVGVLGVPLVLDRLGLPPLSDDVWAYHPDGTWAQGVHADLVSHGRRLPPRWQGGAA